MGTFVKVFSTLSSLEIHQLLHKQTCLVSSHSNQRPTMNKSVMFAVVAVLAQFAASESDKDWCCKVAMVHHNIPKKLGDCSKLVTVEMKDFERNGVTRNAMIWLLTHGTMDVTQTRAPSATIA